MNGGEALGIRFDIGAVGSTLYGLECWKILWRAVDPAGMAGARLYEGDTMATLRAEENVFEIAVAMEDRGALERVRAALERDQAFGGVAASPPFVATLLGESLAGAGMVGADGTVGGPHPRAALEAILAERRVAEPAAVATEIPGEASVVLPADACPSCGAALRPAARFCGSCGTAIPEPAAPTFGGFEAPPFEAPPFEAPPARPPRKPIWPRVLAVLVVITGAAALGFAAVGLVQERLLYPLVAWGFGLLPLGYAIAASVRRRKAGLGFARPAIAGALVAVVLGASTVLVVLSCNSRLRPGGNLVGCDFSGADLAGLDLRRADLSRARLIGTDLGGADLTGATLREAELTDARLVGATLTGASFAGASLERANLASARLDQADLTGANLTGAEVAGVILTRSTLARATLDRLPLDGFDLAGVDLSEASLRDTSLGGASLRDANLARATLDGAKLRGADLRDADLSGADLTGADLTEANLRAATLTGAAVVRTDLRRATLDRAILTGITMTDVTLNRATLIGATGLPDNKLARGLNVSGRDLGRTLTAKDIRLETRTSILTALGVACRGRAVRGAARYSPSGFSPMVILNTKGGRSSLSDEGDDLDWEPMAVRFGQLVACLGSEQQIAIQTCPYFSFSGGAAPSITRYRYQRSVRVVSARAGKAVLDIVMRGSTPDRCPSIASFSQTRIDGGHVYFEDVKPKLVRYVR